MSVNDKLLNALLGLMEKERKMSNWILDTSDQAAREEAQVHDRYCLDLLKKHIPNIEMSMAVSSSTNPQQQILEREGLYIEHHVEPDSVGNEVHSWRLFKLMDSSPKYRIKHVMSVEQANDPLIR